MCPWASLARGNDLLTALTQLPGENGTSPAAAASCASEDLPGYTSNRKTRRGGERDAYGLLTRTPQRNVYDPSLWPGRYHRREPCCGAEPDLVAERQRLARADNGL
jgi:hypothetical protein